MNAIVNKFRKDPPAPKTEEEFVASAPTGTVVGVPAPAAVSAAPHAEKDQVYKSVTLRLTRDRYKALKMLSTTEEESIQDLLTQALDELLAKKA